VEGHDAGTPATRTSLIGREADVQAVSDALSSSRLVTLVGLGGAGKTRLAVEVARRLAPSYCYGARMAELASVTSAAGVVAAILGTLDPPANPANQAADEPSAARLVALLRTHQLLLALDNCEQVLLDAAALTDRLLERCPHLTVLATSREPLRIAGEVVVAVDPLAVAPSSLRHPAPAIELFVARAAASYRGFELTEDNLDPVVAICQLVDGIPLAIELAAARAGHLSIAEIRDRLMQRPGSLASRDPTASERHRTLTATLDWSYRLLTSQEQRVLRRLSLFLDAATAADVAAVCGLEELDTHELLAGLCEKSLVVVATRDGVSRYRLLDTVRAYARHHLEVDGELEAARRAQARWLIARTRQRTREVAARGTAATPATELDDLAATLAWAVSEHHTELALELASATWRTWEQTGRHAEGRQILSEVLQLATEATLHRARVRIAAAHLAFLAGDLATAGEQYTEGLEELRDLDAEDELATSLNSFAMVRLFEGDTDTARALAEKALTRFQNLDDAGGSAFAQTSLGMIETHARDADTAEWHLLEALQGFRRLRLRREAASVLDNLGNLAADLGQPARAHRFYEGALQLQRQAGDARGAALSLNSLCLVAQQRGNLDGAWEAAEAARQLFAEVGDRAGEAATLNNLANLATERGQVRRAMELYGECLQAFREMGDARRLATALHNLADLARSVDERQLAWDCLVDATSLWNRLGQSADVHVGLGELRGLAAAWGVAGLSSFELAATEAEPDPTVVARAVESARWAAVPIPIRSAEVSADGPLTAREAQVVGLVGRGLTNAEIAAELFISERTIESHVSHARQKLGIDSRTKLTRWAIEQGLAGDSAVPP
jgi:predicted ATPase/DNA-binding CsgD family transcriptional regulator